jgi:hypothetical protein
MRTGDLATTAPQPDARRLTDKQTLDNAQLAEVDRPRRMESNTQLRQVQPQQLFPQADQIAWSTLAPETTEFRLLCQGLDEGVITRFVQDKAHSDFLATARPGPKYDLRLHSRR